MDVFGNGKTSLKINAGTYMDPAQWAGIFIEPNPARRQFGGGVPRTTRSWGDANRNYIPDCDLLNTAGNGECGAAANLNFGKLVTPTSTYDPNLLEGLGVRPGNWQFGISVQQEVFRARLGGSRVPPSEFRFVHQPRPGSTRRPR